MAQLGRALRWRAEARRYRLRIEGVWRAIVSLTIVVQDHLLAVGHHKLR
jgi:hypothetical protein